MYDIVFLSYNETKSDENWENLKSRFPRVQRVNGVTGIAAAHQAAAAKCLTKWFWVVDADNIVNYDFDFSFEWSFGDNHTDLVGVWRAENNVNGLVYGYGGIKLLPRRRVLSMNTDIVDFTTSIGNNFRVMPEIASTTIINASPFEAWKSGFRECTKLASSVILHQDQQETDDRLRTWCTVARGDYADEVLRGAYSGRLFGDHNRGNKKALAQINNFAWLEKRFEHDSSITTGK